MGDDTIYLYLLYKNGAHKELELSLWALGLCFYSHLWRKIEIASFVGNPR
jgi:hypothetical protein